MLSEVLVGRARGCLPSSSPPPPCFPCPAYPSCCSMEKTRRSRRKSLETCTIQMGATTERSTRPGVCGGAPDAPLPLALPVPWASAGRRQRRPVGRALLLAGMQRRSVSSVPFDVRQARQHSGRCWQHQTFLSQQAGPWVDRRPLIQPCEAPLDTMVFTSTFTSVALTYM